MHNLIVNEGFHPSIIFIKYFVEYIVTVNLLPLKDNVKNAKTLM